MCLHTDFQVSLGPQNGSSTHPCTQGHEWQPTMIIGYFQCIRCHTLAACHACVSKVRGQGTLVGTCQAHQHLESFQMLPQEVLG